MAIKVIKNQPIQTHFNDGWHCDEYELMQLVQSDDQQRIQVQLSPFAVTAPLSAGSWSLSGGFVAGAGGIAAFNNSYAEQVTSVQAGHTYQVQLNVKFITIDNNGGYRIRVNDQYLTLPDAAGGAYSILSGTITAYVTINSFFPRFVPYIDIQVSGTCIVGFTGVTISELSGCSIVVLDDAKAPIQNFNETLTIYKRNTNIATIVFDWASVNTSGICYLALYDPKTIGANVITNGTFPGNVNGWENTDGTPLDGWSFSAGSPNKASYAGTGTSGNNRFSQFLNLPGAAYYQLNFSFSNMDPGEGVYVYFDVNGEQLHRQLFTQLSSGMWTLDLSAYSGFVSGRIVFEPLNIGDAFKIWGITFIQTADVDNISNPFTLTDNHPLTLSLLGICNQSAFSFDFAHFQSHMRVKGNIQYKDYPDVTEVYDFSDDVAEILDSDAKKFYEVTIHGNPEYIHDAVRLIRLCDFLLINGKEYIKEAGYDMKPVDGILNSTAVFLVRDKIGVPDNYFASGYLDTKYAGR